MPGPGAALPCPVSSQMATEDSLGREIEDAPAQLPSETESAPLLGPKNYADDLDLGKMIWASPGLILGYIAHEIDEYGC